MYSEPQNDHECILELLLCHSSNFPKSIFLSNPGVDNSWNNYERLVDYIIKKKIIIIMKIIQLENNLLFHVVS